jgi:REP element-mobilizing transposase RayT
VKNPCIISIERHIILCIKGDDMKNQNDSTGSAGLQTGIHKGWYNRGYLPHFDQAEAYQNITYRLADSLPLEFVEKLRYELRIKNSEKHEKERRIKIENMLGRCYGECILRNQECSRIVTETWQCFAGERYDLISFVVMPNHVHVLIKIYDGFELGKIVRSWKGYSSRMINQVLQNFDSTNNSNRNNKKRLWQRGYWDRYIRNDKHFNQTLEYIRKNYENGGVAYYIADGVDLSSKR